MPAAAARSHRHVRRACHPSSRSPACAAQQRVAPAPTWPAPSPSPGKSMRAAHEGCVVSDSVTLRRQIPGMNSHTRIPNAPATGSRGAPRRSRGAVPCTGAAAGRFESTTQSSEFLCGGNGRSREIARPSVRHEHAACARRTRLRCRAGSVVGAIRRVRRLTTSVAVPPLPRQSRHRTAQTPAGALTQQIMLRRWPKTVESCGAAAPNRDNPHFGDA